jgi:tetratricopeptide (TPR) repeat protein
MPSYANQLAPWEIKKEYYRTISLGKDVREITKALNNQTKALIASQIASTSAIIASQDRIAEGIDSLAVGVDRAEQGIYELRSAFEWGISEVVWQIEQNREVLKTILEILMAPLDTQAKERRKRAEEAFANGWIDDAETEFLESEKLNKFDFSIHISLGIIYLFHNIDKTKALSYFEKAIKYARPKTPYHTSYALLHKALIKFDLAEIDDAERCAAEAIQLCPDFTEALYQDAQYNAQLKNMAKSISNPEKAIKKDKYYCLKAHKDPLFDPIRERVNELFEKLRNDEKQRALQSFAHISTKYDKVYPVVAELSKETFTETSSFVKEIGEIQEQLSDLRKRIGRDSYFDFIDINRSYSGQIQGKMESLISGIKEKIKSVVDSCEGGIRSAKSGHKDKIRGYLGKTGTGIVVGSFAVPAIMSLIVMEGLSKLWFIAFCIPFVSQIISLIIMVLMIFKYDDLARDRGELIVGWSLVMYLIASACYFFVAKSISKGEMRNEINRKNSTLQEVLPYVEKIKKL